MVSVVAMAAGWAARFRGKGRVAVAVRAGTWRSSLLGALGFVEFGFVLFFVFVCGDSTHFQMLPFAFLGCILVVAAMPSISKPRAACMTRGARW